MFKKKILDFFLEKKKHVIELNILSIKIWLLKYSKINPLIVYEY